MRHWMLLLGLSCFFLGYSDLVFGQDLSYFIEQAEAHSPELEAMRLRYDIMAEKQEEAKALPNTEIGIGLFVSEPETRTGPQKARFSLRQMLPWFGTITARTKYAAQLTAVEYLDWTIARRKLRLRVALSYYALQSIQQQLEIISAQQRILETYRELALAAVSTGKSGAVDVLQIDIRIRELVGQQDGLSAKLNGLTFSFFRLLNLPTSEVHFTPVELPGQLPEQEQYQLGLHPELSRYDGLFASVQAEEWVNRKSAGPNLGIGLDYVPVAERTDMVILENGKDIWMPMVSVSVPVFNTRYRSITRQNELKTNEIQASRLLRQNQLEGLLKEAKQQQLAEKIRFEAQTDNLNRTRQVHEMLLAQYQSESVNLTELLRVQQLELTIAMERIKALEAYLVAGAQMNYLRADEEIKYESN